MNTGSCRNFIKNSSIIPRNFFFYWSGQEFLYVYYLGILSLLTTNRIERCDIFYETEPSGNKHWDGLKSNPVITFKKLDFGELCSLSGFAVEDFKHLLVKGGYNHRSDLFRYLALYCYGGVYLDCDVLVLRDLGPLLETEFFSGFHNYACYQKSASENINSAVLGSIKRAPAVRRLLEEIRDYLKSSPSFEWSSLGPLLLTSQLYPVKSKARRISMCLTEYLFRFSGLDPYFSRSIIALTRKKEFEYRLYPKSYFYYYGWESHEKIFRKSTLPETSYCVHLWNKASFDRLASINEKFIWHDDSLFSAIIKNIIFGVRPQVPLTHKSGLRFIALSRKIIDDFLKACTYLIKNKMANSLKYFYFGDSINLAVSSLCQLNCPVCQTWQIKEKVGSGYLKFGDFKNFVDKYPNFKNIEIAGLGEIFLNPDLDSIIEYAYKKKINLTAFTGVNLNNASEKTIERLASCRFKHLTVSIDGASSGTYQIYRSGGDLAGVIDNIKKINYYKRKHGTAYPELTWQFIVFGHNEHELPAAREMAEKLKMKFKPVFNSVPTYSPVKDNEFVSKEMGFKSTQEWEERREHSWPKYHLALCNQLWIRPQISWDGRLLGCTCNQNPFPVNIFEAGLENALKNEKYIYAKKMLSGKAKGRKDIPCFQCDVYRFREKQRYYFSLASRISHLALLRAIMHKLFPKQFIGLLKLVLGNNINFVQGKSPFLD